MRSVAGFIAVLIIGVVAVGFIRGWFQMSSSRDSTDQKVTTTLTVDKARIQRDTEKLQALTAPEKDTPAERAGDVK